MQNMNATQLMNQHKLKITSSRELLLNILFQSAKPLCYEELKKELVMDKTTFYRNMTTFEDVGIVNGFESEDKKRYFEISKTPHAHFVCKKCYEIECLKEISIDNMIDYEVDNFILHGICKSCNIQKNHDVR